LLDMYLDRTRYDIQGINSILNVVTKENA